MPLSKLTFAPGIVRDTTAYANKGGWYESNHVRFRLGFPEKIGGWQKFLTSTYLGTVREMKTWTTLQSERLLSVGTNIKYYFYYSDAFYDITPIRSTTAAGEATFADVASTLNGAITASAVTITLTDASGFPSSGLIKIDSEEIAYDGVLGNILQSCVRGSNGTTAATHSDTTAVFSSSVLVSDTNHGAIAGAFVTFSGAVSLGGNITATVLNTEYEITQVPSSSTYFIQTSVFANASDSGDGGASVVAAYQINPGPDSVIYGAGWGAGTWGRGTWGSAASISAAGENLRLWSQDNFGEDLIANIRDGDIYYWDRSASGSITSPNRMVELSSLAGANATPTIAKQVLVSDQSRHVLAFGCDGEFTPGVQDPLLIRFSSQESLTDWSAASTTTTAGELRIGSGSEIVRAVETRQQILVFTDAALSAIQYLGPPFIFGLQELAYGITLIGPNAVININDTVYWMGRNQFYGFDGVIRPFECPVLDYVFNDINEQQRAKVFASANTEFHEVTWFYPSASSSENDSYVTYNYKENIWYYGSTGRTGWVDRGSFDYPIAAASNYLYEHEVTNDADGAVLEAYIESSPIDVSDGENFSFISRILPDVSFSSSTSGSPTVAFTVKMQNAMGSSIVQSSSNNVSQTATAPIEQFTQQVFMRLRGRSMRLRIESDELGVAWRFGTPTIDVRTDGRR